MFGVPDARSLAFAFGYHMGGFIPVTVLGLWYASRIGLSLKDVGSSEERVEDAVPYPHTVIPPERQLALYFEVYHLAFGSDDR